MPAPEHRHSSLPSGPIGARHVLALAWPVVVSMLSHTATSVVDTIFVGPARHGAPRRRRIGPRWPSCWPRRSPWDCWAACGCRRPTTTEPATPPPCGGWPGRGLWLGLLLGGLGATLVPLGEVLWPLLGADAAVSAQAAPYFTVRVLGLSSVTLVAALAGWLQGRGDTRTPMVAALLANGLNLALDPLLIFGWGPVPAYGVGGAAAATVFSQAVGGAFLVWRVFSVELPSLGGGSTGAAHTSAVPPWRPDLALLRRVWRVGAPMGVQWLLDVGAFAVFASVLASVGAVHLAAHVIAIRICSVSFLPGHALGQAAGVLVGQSLGAGRPEGAREAFAAAARLAVWVMLVWAVVFVLWPGPLIQVFGAETAVAEVVEGLLILAAAFQVFDAVAMTSFGSLSGAGDTRFTLAASVVMSWTVKLPLGWYLAVPVGLGAVGAWAGLTLEVMVWALVGWLRVRGNRWLQHENVERVDEGASERDAREEGVTLAPAR